MEFLGDWRIIETDVWESDALDLIQPAHLSIESDGTGSLAFIAIIADVDYRVEHRDGVPHLEFSWEGLSEGDPICGRAWARLEGDELQGRLYIHGSDDSKFVARRPASDSSVLRERTRPPTGELR